MKSLIKFSRILFIVFSIYSCKEEKPNTPIITTSNVTTISFKDAISGGNVTYEGSSSVQSRGVCWSIGTTPTITDNKTSNGTGVGDFSSNIYGLKSETVYYVRAYATNNSGTSYGKSMSFKTLSLSCVTITSCAGKTYKYCIDSSGNGYYEYNGVKYNFTSATNDVAKTALNAAMGCK
jgi:hypothetical protein